MQHWFFFLQEFLQSGQHICQRQGYACFSNHSKKIQVEDDNNDLSIGNKFDKYLEAERKEAYEKASLDHDQSKDKKDFFLDNNPKDAGEIINEMTPKTLTQEQMKILEIHDRKSHCGPIFDSNLSSCQPPVCASCMF